MSEASDLRQQIDDLKEERFQMERSLGVDKDRLEKDIVFLTTTETNLKKSIDAATIDLLRIKKRRTGLDTEVKDIIKSTNDWKNEQVKALEAKKLAFEGHIERTLKRISERELKLQETENAIIYKENEFKRIAGDLKRREDAVNELVEKDTKLAESVVRKRKETLRAQVQNDKRTSQLDERESQLDDREVTLSANEALIVDNLADTTRDRDLAKELLEANTKRSADLDIRGDALNVQEEKVAIDKKNIDDGFRLLADRNAMLERNKKRLGMVQ